MSDLYKKAIAEALEAVKGVEDADLKKSGFEIILRQLLQVTPDQALGDKIPAKTISDTEAPLIGSKNAHKNKTGLTDEELETLFEVKGEILVLKVKPAGASVAEQQQTLAHAVLAGYQALLGKNSVSSLAMGAAAHDWNLFDSNFSRKIKVPGYVQSKGVKTSLVYFLRPGSIDKIKEVLQKMARGE